MDMAQIIHTLTESCKHPKELRVIRRPSIALRQRRTLLECAQCGDIRDITRLPCDGPGNERRKQRLDQREHGYMVDSSIFVGGIIVSSLQVKKFNGITHR